MSYSDYQIEQMVAKDASLASAADVGDWAPGYSPVIIRAVALVFTTAVNNSGTLKVDKRPTAGSDTSRGDGDVADIDYTTTTGAQGKVVYQDGIDVEVAPGEEIVFEVTDATPSAGNAHLIIFYEPRWEQPANNTDMSETT